MLAAVVDELGAQPRIEVREVEEPEVGAGESLVAVEAAAVAHFELDVISGDFLAPPPPLPFVAGSEGAGRVVASDTIPIGTLVRIGGAGVGIIRNGCWAERVAAPDTAVEPLPPDLDPSIAAAFYSAVTGATGSVASMTIQLALRAGASKVVGFHRDPAQSQLLPAGSESVIWEGAATAERFSGENAFDLVVDVVGGEMLSLLATRSVKPGGIVAMTGYAGSDELRTSITKLLVADVSLRPVNAINLEDQVKPAAQAMLAEIGTELELRTTRFPLADISEAIELLRAGTAAGRILVEP
jgi:NADPH:quinone reductase